MNVKKVARLIDVSPDTVRRWCDSEYYGAYLSPGATPGANMEREYNEHDLKVLNYVAIQRNTEKVPHSDIKAALAAMQSDGYTVLQDVPSGWLVPESDRIPINEASEQAQHLAELATVKLENRNLRERLEDATERAEKLERELDHLRTTQSVTESQLHGVELELANARGEVQALKTQVESFTFAYGMGRDKPLPMAAIILVTALIVAALVIVLLVVVRLVL